MADRLRELQQEAHRTAKTANRLSRLALQATAALGRLLDEIDECVAERGLAHEQADRDREAERVG